MSLDISLEELHDHVRDAVIVELTTLPTYLYPYWTIKPPEGPHAEHRQAARDNIRTVILEEMLHMGLASNLLNALGGTPDFNHPDHVPTFPRTILKSRHHGDVGVPVDLYPLGHDALELMCRIELPDWDATDGELTIGDFYDTQIRQHLPDDPSAYLDGGQPRRQLAGWDNPGPGKLFDITDKHTAELAITEILDQGEGLRKGDPGDGYGEPAHYDRFRNVQKWWDAHLLTPDDVYPVVASPHRHHTNYSPEQKRANHRFNVEYSQMLDAIAKTLMTNYPDIYPVAAAHMRQLQQLADDLRLVEGDFNAGPTFDYIRADERRTS
ncbi:MAG: ferritin-like protein [Actinomycetota bacterium]